MTQLSAADFAAKWQDNARRERASSQEHFIDLCRLLGVPTPAEADPSGESYTFEAGAERLSTGGQGWAASSSAPSSLTRTAQETSRPYSALLEFPFRPQCSLGTTHPRYNL